MSDLAARIKDLTERIATIKGEFEDRPLGAMRSERRRAFKDDLTDMFFDDDQRQRERLEELERELEAAENELAGQVAAAPTAPDISLEYPEISVPDATDGGAIESPFGQSDPPPPPRSPSPRTDQMLPPDARFFGNTSGGAHMPPTTSSGPKRGLTIDDVANFETPVAGPAPAVTSGGPGVGLIAAAGVISLVLAVGAWQVFASSSPSPVAAAATAAPIPTTTSRPAATAAAVVPSASIATRIRVTGQPAVYSGDCVAYSITFSWIIEGAQSGRFQMRTAKGDTYGPVNGPFTLSGNGSSLTWEPATGRLTIRGASDSGASPGFRSQITTVNGLDVEGDATSIAAPGYCS